MLILIFLQYCWAKFCSGTTLCVYATYTPNSVIITLHSSARGYVALGTGTGMSSSSMVVAWPSANGYTLSCRSSTSHAMPAVSAQVAKMTSLQVPRPAWANIAVSFERPIDQVWKPGPFIFAFANSGPQSSDPSSPFPQHESFGRIKSLDFTPAQPAQAPVQAPMSPQSSQSLQQPSTTSLSSIPSNTSVSPPTSVPTDSNEDEGEIIQQAKPLVSLPESTDYKTIVIIHGVFMTLAWAVSPFIGIIIARYYKDKLGHTWFRIHMWLMLIGCGLFSMIGYLVIMLTSTPQHFQGSHRILGFVLILTMVFQIIVGFLSNALYDPKRTSLPFIDKFHGMLGRLLGLASLVNIFLGFQLFDELFGIGYYVPILFGIYVGLIFAIFVFYEIKRGPVRH